jgi:hypothetical protein
MNRENVGTVRQMLALFTGGIEVTPAVYDLLDPDIEIHDYPGFPDREWHHGAEGAGKFAAKHWGAFATIQISPSQFQEAPDGSLVATCDVAGTGKRSGVRIPATIYAVFKLRAGRVFHIDTFATQAEALEAAGLSE